jgi:hypothetical protein
MNFKRKRFWFSKTDLCEADYSSRPKSSNHLLNGRGNISWLMVAFRKVSKECRSHFWEVCGRRIPFVVFSLCCELGDGIYYYYYCLGLAMLFTMEMTGLWYPTQRRDQWRSGEISTGAISRSRTMGYFTGAIENRSRGVSHWAALSQKARHRVKSPAENVPSTRL